MKSKLSVTAFVVALILSVVSVVQGQAPKTSATEQGKPSPMISRVFVVGHVLPSDLLKALLPLASTGDARGAMLVANDKTLAVSVRDYPENVAAMEAVIRLLDKPERAPLAATRAAVEVQISIIAASQDDGFAETPVPPALSNVVEQLRRTLTFKRYRYVTTLTQRVQSGADARASGAIAKFYPDGPPTSRPEHYEYALRNPLVMVPESGLASIRVDFDFALMMSYLANLLEVTAGTQPPKFASGQISMSTPVTFREGEPTVVGTSRAGDGSQAVIVILSIRRIGA